MTYEELLRRISELEQENIILRRQLREKENDRTVSYDDLQIEYIDDKQDKHEDIKDETYVVPPVMIDASKSANSSVSETKDNKKENRSELRRRLFPWLNKKSISKISDEQEEFVDINQFATTDKKGSNNQSDDTVTEDKSLDLSDFSFVDINEEENKNQEENESKPEDENVNDEAVTENQPLDLSGFSFVDINEEENKNQEENQQENENGDDFSGYYFDDDEVVENEDNNKKRRFPFFGKKKEKIDYQPKHMRKTKKLERIRESKFFKKIKSALNNKAVKVIAAVLIAPVAIGGIILAAKLSNDEKNNDHDNTSNVLYDNSEVPSTTAANEISLSAKDVASSVDKKDDNSDKKETSTSDEVVGSYEYASNEEDIKENDIPESSSDEVVDSYEYESNEEDIKENSRLESTSDEVADSYEYENSQEDIQEHESLKSIDDEAVISGEYENNQEYIQENNRSESTSDEAVESDLTDYTIVDDGYGVEIGYDIGDSVHFDRPYIHRTGIDEKNDTNRYNPLYPSTDEGEISVTRLVSPDGSEKITINANNKDKKDQLEAQGWTIESYNIDDLTNGVTDEGWTPGKSLK